MSLLLGALSATSERPLIVFGLPLLLTGMRCLNDGGVICCVDIWKGVRGGTCRVLVDVLPKSNGLDGGQDFSPVTRHQASIVGQNGIIGSIHQQEGDGLGC